MKDFSNSDLPAPVMATMYVCLYLCPSAILNLRQYTCNQNRLNTFAAIRKNILRMVLFMVLLAVFFMVTATVIKLSYGE